MSRRRPPLLRAMTLVEVMVVGAIAASLAAAGGSTLVEQVRRSRAVEGARNALLPHAVARDRAVAARTCVESVLLPPTSQAFFVLNSDLPAEVLSGQTDKARVAVVQWSRCDAEATVVKVDFYDLEGQVEFDAYSSADGRMVFGIDGGLTMDRPAAASGASLPPRCVPPKQGSSRSGGGPGPAPVCMPAARMGLPAPDVSFSARTYFGEVHGFKTFSRIGTTEAVPIS